MPLPQTVNANRVGAIISDSELADLSNRDYTNVTNLSEAGTGGNLIFSDNPETVPPGDVNTVLCYSPVDANTSFRVYLDHVNNTGSDQQVDVWIKNLNVFQIATVTAYATGEGFNGTDQMTQYMKDLIGPPTPTTYKIPKGQMLNVAGTEPNPLPNGANFCLVWDFFTDTDIGVYVTIGDSVNFAVGAPFLPLHTRGTFPGMNIDKTLSTPLEVPGPSGIPVSGSYKTIPIGADYTALPPLFYKYRDGYDWTVVPPPPAPYPVPRTGTTADFGIFGMLYSIEIPLSNSASYPVCVGVVLNARGNSTIGLEGIVADRGAPGVIVSDGPYGATDTAHGMIVSKTLLQPGDTKTKRFYFMIPSGSSSPEQFVIVPFSGSCGA